MDNGDGTDVSSKGTDINYEWTNIYCERTEGIYKRPQSNQNISRQTSQLHFDKTLQICHSAFQLFQSLAANWCRSFQTYSLHV